MTSVELILLGAGAAAIVVPAIVIFLVFRRRRRIRFRLVVGSSRAEGDAGAEAAPAGPERCAVELVRDTDGGHWEARSATGPVAASPTFALARFEVPQPSVASLAALEALSAVLEREGWTLSGRDEPWYARRFTRSRASRGRGAPPAASGIAQDRRRRSRG